jgi:HAD superfamily hydrolase (TIGR01662 family)
LIRAVLVDLGDTLVHLSRPWDDVFQDNLESLYTYLKNAGLRSDFQDFAKTFIREFERASATSQFYKVEIPIQDIVSRVLRSTKLKNDSGLVQNAIAAFYRPEIDAWQLYPDAVQTLTELRRNGFRLGLISNAKSDYAVRMILEKHDLTQFFGVILTSAAVGLRKPRTDIFSKALAALDTKPSEAVFVGDSLQADMLGARTAGIRSIHVLRKPIEDPRFVRPDVTVNNLNEALDQITSWNGAKVANLPSGTLGPH